MKQHQARTVYARTEKAQRTKAVIGGWVGQDEGKQSVCKLVSEPRRCVCQKQLFQQDRLQVEHLRRTITCTQQQHGGTCLELHQDLMLPARTLPASKVPPLWSLQLVQRLLSRDEVDHHRHMLHMLLRMLLHSKAAHCSHTLQPASWTGPSLQPKQVCADSGWKRTSSMPAQQHAKASPEACAAATCSLQPLAAPAGAPHSQVPPEAPCFIPPLHSKQAWPHPSRCTLRLHFGLAIPTMIE